jgi:anti-sigma factor RsiW
MSCKAYNRSLIDAATSGALSPALRGHLAECEACHAAFAQVQSLYAAIDSGLRAAANPEIPSTLLPRVRVALNNEPLPHANFQKWVFVGAILVCTLAAAITLQFRHREAPSPTKVAIAESPALPSPRLNEPHPSALAAGNSIQQPDKAGATGRIPARVAAPLAAEVLVPDEERAAFEKFLAREQSPSTNSSAAALLVPEAPKELVPLPAVEIASLKVLPLNGEEENQGEF